MKLASLSMRDFAAMIGPSALASVGVVISVVVFRHMAPPASKPVLQLMEEVAVGGVVGVAVLLSADAQLRVSLTRMFGMLAKLTGRTGMDSLS